MVDPIRLVDLHNDGSVAYVRTLITDDGTIGEQMFTDDQLAELIVRNHNSTLMGAAAALDIIASSEALLSKRISSQDLVTDGPAVAKSLREHADRLRAQWRTEQADSQWGIGSWPMNGEPTRPEATEWALRW